MDTLTNPTQFYDLNSLDSLRAKTQQQDPSSLREVAKQFESIFVQMLMKSMREANSVFESDNPMNNQYVKFYQQMQDQQMSIELGGNGVLGLADLMVQQLSGTSANFTPASVLRDTAKIVDAQSSTTNKNQLAVKAYSNVLNDITPKQFTDPQSFIKHLFPLAKDAAQKLGVNPSVLLAQSALETGWGKKVITMSNGDSSFNLFNIKADDRWQGEKIKSLTSEYQHGAFYQTQADFRAYDSYKESFNDFVNFIKNNSRYEQARKLGEDPKSFIQGLKNAGYATDPDYVKKVMSVLQVITEKISSL